MLDVFLDSLSGNPRKYSPPSLFIDAFLFDLISFFEQQNFFDLLFHSNLK